MEELQHRRSFDLDFHTLRALEDVRPILAEMRAVFPKRVEVIQAPDEFGSGFRALLSLEPDARIPVEVLSSYEDIPAGDIVASRTLPGLYRVTLQRYLADKIQCIAERNEARDLVDITAVLDAHPELEALAREALQNQDELLVGERLLAWTEEELGSDLSAYPEINLSSAVQSRDMLLKWLKES